MKNHLLESLIYRVQFPEHSTTINLEVHNPKVGGSILPPATNVVSVRTRLGSAVDQACAFGESRRSTVSFESSSFHCGKVDGRRLWG
jgi:hypothetical protein